MVDQIYIDINTVNGLRIRKGQTRTELAEACGFAPHTSVKINRGGPVSMRTLRRLAESLGVGITRIIAVTPCGGETIEVENKGRRA